MKTKKPTQGLDPNQTPVVEALLQNVLNEDDTTALYARQRLEIALRDPGLQGHPMFDDVRHPQPPSSPEGSLSSSSKK